MWQTRKVEGLVDHTLDSISSFCCAATQKMASKLQQGLHVQIYTMLIRHPAAYLQSEPPGDQH